MKNNSASRKQQRINNITERYQDKVDMFVNNGVQKESPAARHDRIYNSFVGNEIRSTGFQIRYITEIGKFIVERRTK